MFLGRAAGGGEGKRYVCVCVGGGDCLGDLTNPLGSAFLFMFGRLRDLVTGIWEVPSLSIALK